MLRYQARALDVLLGTIENLKTKLAMRDQQLREADALVARLKVDVDYPQNAETSDLTGLAARECGMVEGSDVGRGDRDDCDGREDVSRHMMIRYFDRRSMPDHVSVVITRKDRRRLARGRHGYVYPSFRGSNRSGLRVVCGLLFA